MRCDSESCPLCRSKTNHVAPHTREKLKNISWMVSEFFLHKETTCAKERMVTLSRIIDECMTIHPFLLNNHRFMDVLHRKLKEFGDDGMAVEVFRKQLESFMERVKI